MNKRYRNTAEYIKECINVYGDKYDFSETVYNGWVEKVDVICKIHGKFSKEASRFVRGIFECNKCREDERRISYREIKTKQCIIDAKIIHGERYDYSESLFKDTNTKMKIGCSAHGMFEQSPYNHINKKANCPQCVFTYKKTKLDWLSIFREVHGESYNYRFPDKFNCKSKINIECKKHGWFKQSIDNHNHKKHGCPSCGIKTRTKSRRLNTKIFKEKAILIHGIFYDYSKSVYGESNHDKVEIGCPIHGMFEQRAIHHLFGYGCQICSSSSGERDIRKILLNHNIKFKQEKSFKGCVYDKKLRFDFYLPEHNICIEYDGIQHFEAIDYFGGNKVFREQLEKDNVKNQYCEQNNIKLLRISYKEDVEGKLKQYLKLLL